MADSDFVVVHESWDYGEAVTIQSALRSAGILCEILNIQFSTMTLGGGGPAACMRLVVPPDQAHDAARIVEDMTAHAEPDASSLPPDLTCPNCGGAVLGDEDACRECSFTRVFVDLAATPLGVREVHPDARSVCVSCLSPSVNPGGTCSDCGEDLRELEDGELVCPEKKHVMRPSEKKPGAFICLPCLAAVETGERFTVEPLVKVGPLAEVHAVFTDAQTYCEDCRVPSTRMTGPCGFCQGTLRPIAPGTDLLCAKQDHVVSYEPERKGYVCRPCKAVFVEPA